MRSSNVEPFVILGILLVIIVFWLSIMSLFCLTLMRCFQRIQPQNRTLEPWTVWLRLIPCVGTIFIFIIVTKLTESLRKEYRWRRWGSRGEGFGNGGGMAYAVLNAAGHIPYIGVLFTLAAFVCFIVYWVQIANYSSRLAQPFEDRRFDDDFDDIDRDYERRRVPRADDYGDRDRGGDRIRPERRDDDLDAPDERIRAGE